MDNQKIGSFVRDLRKEKDMTQKDLADRLHITDRAVSKWERGLNAPDIALLEPLAEALGVSVSELIRGGRGSEPQTTGEETKSILDYSKSEVVRKVSHTRKKYLGLLVGILALALLIGGILLWRSGVLFLLDTKVSPDGQSVARVYSKDWHWTSGAFLQDEVRVEETHGEEKRTRIYGNGEATYEGLWWSPDSQKYVIVTGYKDGAMIRFYDWSQDHYDDFNIDFSRYLHHLVPEEEWPDADYQFLQWGKDSASILMYYSFTDHTGEDYEGYFWYNIDTRQYSGLVEMEKS